MTNHDSKQIRSKTNKEIVHINSVKGYSNKCNEGKRGLPTKAEMLTGPRPKEEEEKPIKR